MGAIRNFGAAGIVLAAGVAAAADTALADGVSLHRTFEDPAPAEHDGFGGAVAVAGDRVLVGAFWDDTGGEDVGQAHLFDAATGDLLTTFDDPNPTARDGFGSSVALHGTLVLIGAPNDDTNGDDVGQVHLFDAETGALLMTFDDPTPTDRDRFGRPVALDGSLVLVGAAGDDTAGNEVGQAYLFDAVTGALLHTLDEPTPTDRSSFGRSVAIGGGRLLVGADLDDTNGDNVGQAHLFDAATGDLLATFDDPTPTRDGSFGGSVALDGTHVLIGARWDGTNGDSAGQAYLFDVETGALLMTFEEPNPAPESEFGLSVALDGGHALVGALWDDTGAENVGRAYLFHVGTGALVHTIDNPAPTERDVFGGAVAVDGRHAVIGAAGADADVANIGRAYLFTIDAGAP